MKTKLSLSYVAMLLVIAIVVPGFAGEPQNHKAPNIEGTYKLVSRMLPDGTMKKPPDVMGLFTYTKSYRNFNVIVKDANGKFNSYSVVSTYKLSATEYSETILFSISND